MIQELRRDYGGVIEVGSNITPAFEDRLPAQIFGVNVITGGGIPYNAITEIFGPPATFKSTIALGLAKSAQQVFGKNCAIAVVSTESAGLDLNWVRHQGVKIPYSDLEIKMFKNLGVVAQEVDRIVASQEGGGKFILLYGDNAETELNKVKRLLLTGELNLYILDSIGAMVTDKELAGEHEDVHVALNPKLVNRHCNFLLSLCNRLSRENLKTALVIINQIRAKIGGWSPTGEATDTPGGYALKHDKHLALKTRVASFVTTNKKTWAKQISITVDKSKICVPHRSCQVTYVIRGDNPRGLPIGPDIYSEVTDLAVSSDIFKYQGNKWFYGDGVLELNGEQVKREDLALILQTDPDLLKMVQDDILQAHKALEIRGIHKTSLPDPRAKIMDESLQDRESGEEPE